MLQKIITEEMIKDSRLVPLFCDASKLLLRLFVLKAEKRTITENQTINEKTHRIVYGFCIRNTREDINNGISPINFSPISGIRNGQVKYSIGVVDIYSDALTIVNLVNDLLLGKNLKDVISSNIGVGGLGFDVFYTKNFAIRPTIFNNTDAFVYRNVCSKNALTSPYKEHIPSVTLAVCHLDKMHIISDGENIPEICVILSILKHLEEETHLHFLTSDSIRFGNIEFITTQCANEFEVEYVHVKKIKEEVTVDNKNILGCKKLAIYISPNMHTCSKELLINCVLKNGEQTMLDECRTVYHDDGKTIKTIFECADQICSADISIWKKENDIFQIWYRDANTTIRDCSVNMGIVSLQGKLQSDWLNTIKKSNCNVKNKVEQVEQITKVSNQSIHIGAYNLDPWVDADKVFQNYINSINPRKSDAEFFPKGWNDETKQHGAISFLEWFKDQTKNATAVIIQDPYYETVGLEFLLRANNEDTDFTILTCTKTHDRADKLRLSISSYPSLFDCLKLRIYDVGSTVGKSKNILHDRYILIFQKDALTKGFHLSNSIQKATQNYPLLITPIPQDVLPKIYNHIKDTVTGITPLYDYEDVPQMLDNNSIVPPKIFKSKFYHRLKYGRAFTVTGLLRKTARLSYSGANWTVSAHEPFARLRQRGRTNGSRYPACSYCLQYRILRAAGYRKTLPHGYCRSVEQSFKFVLYFNL